MQMQPRSRIAAAWLARQRPDYYPEPVEAIRPAPKREPVVRTIASNGQVVLRYRPNGAAPTPAPALAN